MERRTYLAGAASAGLLFVPGCVGGRPASSDATGTTGATSPAGSDTPGPDTPITPIDQADDVAIQVWNRRASTESVHLHVVSESASVLETTVEVGGDDEAILESGIEEAGSYELRVEVAGGGKDTYPFSVDEYALRHGSDVIVEILDDRVRTVIEE